MRKPAVGRPPQQRDREPLKRALGALDSEAGPDELAAELIRLVASQRGVTGARFWRVTGNLPTIWQETGKLPAPQASRVEGLLAGKREGAANTGSSTWVLGDRSGRIGVLEAFSETSLPAKTRQSLELLRRYAAVALASSERRNAVVELSTVIDATKRLNSTLDLAELIRIILEIATRHTGADRGTVFLVDHERDEIWSLVGLGLEEKEIRLPANRGVAGWVAHHGESVNLADAYADPRFAHDVDRQLGYRTRSLLSLPIRNKDGKTVGVLQLLNKRTGPFTAADERLLHAISEHIALALENARLHRESLAKQRKDRDLALARSIQLGLLPERPPLLPGYDIAVAHRSSFEVAGDYYDFLALTPQTMLMVIADVEGRGVSSAMVMANFQATLHALLAHLHSLERLASSLSDAILADTRGQKFMTMFLGLLDQRHGVLHYVNAGHVPPAVVRTNGAVEHLSEGGLIVGMFPGVKYERGFARLSAGDIVVGCTDGITEAANAQEAEFGIERLVDVVRRRRASPAQAIADSVLTETEQFSRGGPRDDDRVVLVLKVL
jgi:sigma-B regulation protein RsbU (phosphoserine phosphatase)